MILAQHLVKDGRPLNENLTTLFDCLFTSLKVLSVHAKANKTKKDEDEMHHYRRQPDNNTDEKMIWFPILASIRRVFLCLDSVCAQVEKNSLAYKEKIETVLKLQSLRDLVTFVPSSCERVRNLFQFLLLDSLKHFNNAIKTAKIGEDQ